MTNHIVLFEPLFPANTGNIARTCAGTDTVLHLIKPLGFSTDDKHMKRAGLDYWDKVKVVYHDDLVAFLDSIDLDHLYIVSKFAERDYSEVNYTIRALNLSNTAAIVIYEALRQQGFPNLARVHKYPFDKLK